MAKRKTSAKSGKSSPGNTKDLGTKVPNSSVEAASVSSMGSTAANRSDSGSRTPSIATQTAKPATGPRPDTPSQEQIAKRAYEIWVARGKPQGKDLENWRQAERELLGR